MESLLKALKEVCKTADVQFGEIKELLGNLVGKDTIIDFHICVGPYLVREDVLVDVFVLSPSCLYNVEVRRKEILCHWLILDKLSIIEEVSEGEDIAYLLRTGTHDIIMRSKVSERYDAEEFCSKIKDAAIAARQSNK